jgi:hypothetical protein
VPNPTISPVISISYPNPQIFYHTTWVIQCHPHALATSLTQASNRTARKRSLAGVTFSDGPLPTWHFVPGATGMATDHMPLPHCWYRVPSMQLNVPSEAQAPLNAPPEPEVEPEPVFPDAAVVVAGGGGGGATVVEAEGAGTDMVME